MISVLVGGVGGGKLALGLARVVPAGELTVIVNTAADLEWHGLRVSPDVDTVLYTLSGLANCQTGWGIAGDSTAALDALATYGLETWFRVDDRDLATHIARTEWLYGGSRLTEVVERLAQALGVRPHVLPMSDQPVRTVIHTDEGDLPFQEYLVHRATDVTVRGDLVCGDRKRRAGPRGFRSASVIGHHRPGPVQSVCEHRTDPRSARLA